MSIRDKILNAKDIKSEVITIDEWDVKIEIRTLTGLERSKLMNNALNIETGTVDFTKIYPELAIAASFDPESGEKIFSEGDRDIINGKSGAALEKIAQVAMRLSGMDKGAVKEAEKNS